MMYLVILTTVLNISWNSMAWADRASDLQTIHQVCIKKGVNAFEGRKIKKDKVTPFCDCVKRNMDDEFTDNGDEKYLSLIANFEGANTKKDKASKDLDSPQNEGAYVFMDLFLDIRQECAADPNTKTNRRPNSEKKS